MFLQPDWFEVTQAGVGTNRFSYSFNDPVNKFDPGGNQTAHLEAMQDDDEREDAYRHNLKEAQDRLERLRDEEGDLLLIQQAEEDVGYYSSRIGATRSDLLKEGAFSLGVDLLTAGALRGLGAMLPSSVTEAITGAGRPVSNPVPDKLVRVIPGDVRATTLGAPGADDVFVTTADDIAGLSAKEVAERLTIPESPSGFRVIEFPSPSEGLASPILRDNPGFVGGGQTAGGAREWVVPNSPIPSDSTFWFLE
jgi:Novel toxin 10